MRVVFMGTPEFAVPTLRALHEAHEVVAVWTRPDAVSGRGKVVSPSPVKRVGVELGLEVREGLTVRDSSVVGALQSLEPDVIVVAAFGAILPKEILAVPRFGCINVHASFLPRWRGAAPVQRAILAGDVATGVSIMHMEEGLDTGPVCANLEVGIGDMNADALTRELATAGAELLIDALGRVANATCVWVPQGTEGVTYAEKITKHDVALHPDLSWTEFLGRVRASSDSAPARCGVAGHAVTIVDVGRTAEGHVGRGSVLASRRELLLGCADGAVAILTLRPNGKQTMSAADWARGSRIQPDAVWDGLS